MTARLVLASGTVFVCVVDEIWYARSLGLRNTGQLEAILDIPTNHNLVIDGCQVNVMAAVECSSQNSTK